LASEIKAIESFMETTEVLVKKQMLEKVRKQLADISALVDLW
jgi:hypothetical protein